MSTVAVPTTIATGRRQLVDVREHALLTAKWRGVWIAGVFALLAASAVSRIAYLGAFDTTESNFAFDETMVPRRGEIVDRNGVPLAREISAYSLWFNPKAMHGGGALVKTPREVAHALVGIFPDLDETELVRRLSSDKGSYLRKRMLPEEVNRVAELGEPALEAPRETERYYPQGSMAAHVLGFVDTHGAGKVGMEQAMQRQLTDQALRATPQVLSIDTRVQGALEEELARGMSESEAKGAAGIVLDVDTGEVLALASLPSFNPNYLDQASVPNIFNHMTNEVYELGSVMKPICVAAAMDAGTVTNLARRYPAGPLRIGNATIHDSHHMGASLNVAEALIHSSNIVTAQIGLELGGPRLKSTMESLGMNARPQIELPARGFPIWHGGEWSKITTATVSFGHGIAVTPLHLASAYAALVNGGVWRPATLYKVQPGQARAGRQVFSPATSARMRQLLRMIVVYGTGKKADANGFRVGGKTGSAEKPGAHGGGYNKTSLIATFAAAFPMDHPRYVVIAMLDEPQGTQATSGQRTAAWNSAPVVGRVVPRIGPMLGIMPDAGRDIDITDLRPLIPGKAQE
jgi:cell division protein FtsI (penicillin-binding protein 3)